jgi:hypothetical protein
MSPSQVSLVPAAKELFYGERTLQGQGSHNVDEQGSDGPFKPRIVNALAERLCPLDFLALADVIRNETVPDAVIADRHPRPPHRPQRTIPCSNAEPSRGGLFFRSVL